MNSPIANGMFMLLFGIIAGIILSGVLIGHFERLTAGAVMLIIFVIGITFVGIVHFVMRLF